MMSNNNDNSKQKDIDIWSICIGNINSFPTGNNGTNQYKIDKLYEFLKGKDIDMALISEHNRNLKQVPYSEQPGTIMKRWWQQTIVRASFLESNNKSVFEPGGTMIITHSRSTAHTCASGSDNQQLGRWNFVTLKGKQETYTTIISVYRPSRTQETYNRQVAYSSKRRKTLNSIETQESLWFSDLGNLINEQREKGHHVIVAGDFNDNLNDANGMTRTFMRNMGLRELLLEKYTNGPATYVRGTNTIDGVFATSSIQIYDGKYSTFEHSPSDHRWITIDIPENILVGKSRDDKIPPLLRKATSKVPSTKEQFQLELDKQVVTHKLHKKTTELYEISLMQKHLSPQQQQTYELIEDMMQRCVKSADRKCRKARRGHVPFSPFQKKLMGNIIVLKQIRLRWVLKNHKNRPRTRIIERMKKKYNYDGKEIFDSLEGIDKALCSAIKTYNEFKINASQSRYGYLVEIAHEYNDQDGKGVQHHFKILLQQEQSREYFKRIRYCEGKNKGKGVDKVQIDNEGSPTIVYEKSIIEQEIMRANQNKLLQAQDTPLCGEQLSILLGEQGDFTKWEQILTGRVALPNDIDEGLFIWYNYITRLERHPPIDITWTTEEYINSWAKMNENKTTIPGIQVAHIKCLETTSLSADVISKLALIPLLTGYSPETWRKGIDSMIPKKVADLRPEKLRLILLMDARFNHNNKLIGKRMMEYGERYNMLAPEQYGSRKNKSAIDHAGNKRFTMDVIRQSGTKAIYIANDAKSCYDRIILMVAYLTMRTHGISDTVAKSTIYTILNMKHYVRTAFGDSTGYYGGDKWTIKPHGCGQGNGYGPALWACISSPLLHILRNQGYGTKFHTPLSEKFIHLAAFSFVDDTDIFQTQNVASECEPFNSHALQNSYADIYGSSQRALTLWAQSLAATGGELEPSKTFYIPIFPQWEGNKLRLDQQASHHTLTIKDSKGTSTVIERKQPTEPFFSLGIWQSPDGSETRQQLHLLDIIKQWGFKTSHHKLTWQQARIAVKFTIGRTLAYSLPATAFTSRQCDALQKTYLQEVLGKIGIVRTFPANLAVAPVEFGGLGLLSFEIEQLIAHVNLILHHGPQMDSVTGRLLRTSIEYFCLESGLKGDPLLMSIPKYTTDNIWITHTLQSFNKFGIQINSDIDGLETWTNGDIMLMELFSDIEDTNTLRTLNKVRMFLRVVTISDLLSADGQYYDENIVYGKRGYRNPNPSFYRYKWPPIPTPTPKERTLWYNVITNHLKMDHPSLRVQPRGNSEWKAEAIDHSKWTYSASTGNIHQRRDSSQWTIWTRDTSLLRRRTRSAHNLFRSGVSTTQLPTDSIIIGINRVSPNNISPQFLPNSCQRLRNIQHIPLDSTRVTDMSPLADKRERLYLYNILMQNGKVFSDGSYSSGRATYAIVMQPNHLSVPLDEVDFHQLLWKAGNVPGTSKYDTNSYRAELAGILKALEFTNNLCNRANIQEGSCTLYCDNKGALLASFGSKRPTPRWASYDLLRLIRDTLRRSPITWHFQHIKGHQDNHQNLRSLSIEAQGNVLADLLASRQLADCTSFQDHDSDPSWTLRINGSLVCGNINFRLNHEIHKLTTVRKWTQLLCPNFGSPNMLNWAGFFNTWSHHPSHMHIQLVKYNTRSLPVGKNLKRRRHSEHDCCPCCGEIEDHDHILQCTHREMSNTFEEIYDGLSAWMDTNIPDNISGAVKHLIKEYRQHKDNSLHQDSPCHLLQLQRAVGSRAFFAGLWIKGWEDALEEWHEAKGSRRSAMKWITQLKCRIQLFPISMWKTRNQLVHTSRDNYARQKQHEHLNQRIDELFQIKPHPRLLAHCDNNYFIRYSKDQVKNMKLQRKTNWVTGANLIISNYERNSTEQSMRFRSFFQWDPG